MQAKVLFITDLHKRCKDFSTIGGYTEVITQIQLDILEYVQREGITHIVQAGDWYDGGYHNALVALSDNELDRQLSASVNGNFFITVGNHHMQERDSNPESYLTQEVGLRPMVVPNEPIFRCVNELLIHNVLISFFHFNKTNKDYRNVRQPDVRCHIGVYHDDCVVPSDIRQQSGYFGETSSTYLSELYENIDYAIVGHIHVPCGIRSMATFSGHNMSIIIPGALCVTENKDIAKHKSVSLPVFTIDENTCALSYAKFSTHLDRLKFYRKDSRNKLTKAIIDNQVSDVFSGASKAQRSRTLHEYMRYRGYTKQEMELVEAATTPGVLDIVKAIDILNKTGDEENGVDLDD